MPGPSRRFLVIVRAGEMSLHRNWLEGPARTWDLVVSWYGDETYVPVADERVFSAKGWKWDVLGAQFLAHPELVDDYDYVFVPDDDIDTDAGGINELFRLTARYSLAVSQPGLTPDSYFSVLHTMACASFILRYSSFVEVMAPCLSQATLRRMLPYFRFTGSGIGMSRIWTRLEDDNRRRGAIIDAAPMRHTRPVGRFLKGRMLASGQRPKDEAGEMMARFGLPLRRREFYCYAGIAISGAERGRLSTAFHMLVDYCLSSRRWVQSSAWLQVWDAYRRLWNPAKLTRVVAVDLPANAPKSGP